MDSRWWVIHAEQSLREGTFRVRETKVDNYPYGRELHWSSGPIWLMDATARALSAFSGKRAIDELPNAVFWVGPITLILCATLIGSLVGRRFGWGYAGFIVLVLTTCFPIYEMFRSGEADHHGLVCIFAVASVFSLVAGGAGLSMATIREGNSRISSTEKPLVSILPLDHAKRWFCAAGCFGALGLWVSAASMIPVLAGCALGALVAVLVAPKDDANVMFRPELWLIWGRWGCIGSLGLYAVEYFPAHLGWRLEVNHPVYAIAWLAGSGLVARACRKLAGGRLVLPTPQDRVAFAVSLVGLMTPVAIIWLASDATFWVANPFLLRLHTHHILEFRPLWVVVQGPEFISNFAGLLLWPLLAATATAVLVLRAKVPPLWRAPLALAISAAAVVQLEAFFQVRWAGLALGLWSVCVILLVLIHRESEPSPSLPLRVTFAAFACLGAIAILAFPQASFRNVLAMNDAANQLPRNLVPTILLRDIAHRLIESSPSKIPVVLSDPTSSTDLSYYGGIRTIGTLYWDNLPGLKRAAQIFAAPTESDLRNRLAEAKVTCLVIPSWDSLSSGSAFAKLLRYDTSLPSSGAGEAFLDEILQGKKCPTWLRPIYYPIPEAFGFQGERIQIFEVRFDQTPFESYFFQGVYDLDAGAPAIAVEMFRNALKIKPGDPSASQGLKQAIAAVAQSAK